MRLAPGPVVPPWVRTAFLLFLTAAFLYPLTSMLYRVGDDGTIIYGAQRVMDGAIPGRDFVEVMGPGSFYWLAGFFKLFGTSWQVTRMVLLGTGVATVGLLYAIARQACSESTAFLLWLYVSVIGMRIWPAASHHWDSNLFAIAALWCYLRLEKTRSRRWAIAAGILAGITSCCMQHKGLLLLAAFVVAAVARRLNWKLTGLIAAAYAGVGVAVFGAYWSAGALGGIYYANVVWPMSGYHAINVVPFGQLLLSIAVGPSFKVMGPEWAATSLALAALSLLPFLMIACLPLLTPIAMFFDGRESRRGWLAGNLPAITLAGTALWISEIHRKDVFHLIYGSPVLLIAFLATFSIVLKPRLRRCGFTLLAASLIVFGTLHFIGEGKGAQTIQTRRGTVLSSASDDALRYLCAAVKPGEFVFVYPYSPAYYYLAEVRNPTRFSILLYQYNTPEQFDEVIANLEDKQVRYVLWDTRLYGEKLRLLSPAYRHPTGEKLKLENYLASRYEQTAMKGDFWILRRRDGLAAVHSASF